MGMMSIYGLSNCDTCRKAARSLREAGHDVTLHDVRKDPVDEAQLKGWLDMFQDALVNRKSATWRGLEETERNTAPIDLLIEYPALMKRPVVVTEDETHLGWTSEVRKALDVE